MNIDPQHYQNALHLAAMRFLKLFSVFVLIIMACVISAMFKGCERADDRALPAAIPQGVHCPAQYK